MTNSEIEEFKRQCDKAIQLGVALERLESNEDFKLITNQGFCKDFALKYLEQSSRVNQDKDSKANALFFARCPSILKLYLESIKGRADTAQQQLTDIDNLNEEDN